MRKGLICFYYRPGEQREKLAGGCGETEMIVSSSVLGEARKRALRLSSKVHTLHKSHQEGLKGIEKEAIVLNGEVIIVIPTVDNLLKKPLDTYIEYGWPGLLLQSDNYDSLMRTAELLGNLPVPPRDCEYLRS